MSITYAPIHLKLLDYIKYLNRLSDLDDKSRKLAIQKNETLDHDVSIINEYATRIIFNDSNNQKIPSISGKVQMYAKFDETYVPLVYYQFNDTVNEDSAKAYAYKGKEYPRDIIHFAIDKSTISLDPKYGFSERMLVYDSLGIDIKELDHKPETSSERSIGVYYFKNYIISARTKGVLCMSRYEIQIFSRRNGANAYQTHLIQNGLIVPDDLATRSQQHIVTQEPYIDLYIGLNYSLQTDGGRKRPRKSIYKKHKSRRLRKRVQKTHKSQRFRKTRKLI